MGERKLSGKPIELREADFKRLVNTFTKYSTETRDAFFLYWTEPDRAANPKMRFEKEKTWDTGRRLGTWDRNGFGNKNKGQAPVIHIETKKPVQNEVIVPPIQRLEQALMQYKGNPGACTIAALMAWGHLQECYEIIKQNKLWSPEITKQIIAKVQRADPDPDYLKAHVILWTFEFYGKSKWMFQDTLNTRK
jgi:hypothetical protein